ncbi:MAG: Gfo/Idh/MocA family oxidoreductase [Planctomycetota bacterium]
MSDGSEHSGPGGSVDTPRIRLAIAGLGRSGWNIHAHALRNLPSMFTITAVMDPDAERCAQAHAEFGCAVFDDYDAMLATARGDRQGFDAVVVASPSHLHAAHACSAMAIGLHVVAEKPFATESADAERMLDMAHAGGVVLAPFQNRRFESHYRKVREIIDSGALGEVVLIRMCWHRFTRRWDWQAVREMGGGALYNNGTHLIDQALPLLGDAETEVFIDLRRGLSVGDADEHMKMVLKPDHGPTIDIEYTNAAAFEQDRWYVLGTSGGLVGTQDRLRWKTVDWESMPPRPLDLGPAAGRKYPGEDIDWRHHEWSQPDDDRHPYERFYINLHGAVSRGEALEVTPESAVRYVRLLERCQRAAEHALS